MSALKRTPLYDLYANYGAKTVDFAGYDMPVQFAGIVAEHTAVRTSVGLFDVSHMGEIELSGTQALGAVQRLVTNDVSRLRVSEALYTPMCNDCGGTVDDVLVYCLEPQRYLMVVNASNIAKDMDWITEHASDAVIVNRSSETAQLALQGPAAIDVLAKLTETDIRAISYYAFLDDVVVAGRRCLVSRTGYTGEDGFELYMANADAVAVFQGLMAAGEEFGIVPVGLGARDTLRLEARLPLYGHELLDDITPLEAGLGSFVKLDKPDFIGKTALLAQKQAGIARKLVGFALSERGVARAGYPVLCEGEPVGIVTSGTFAPTVKQSIGLALVQADHGGIGQALHIAVRGKEIPATVVKTPFYRRPK